MKLSEKEPWPNPTELRKAAECYKEAIENIRLLDYEIGRWENVNPLGFLYDPATGEVTKPPFSNEEGYRALKELMLTRREALEGRVRQALELMLKSGPVSDVAKELCRNGRDPT